MTKIYTSEEMEFIENTIINKLITYLQENPTVKIKSNNITRLYKFNYLYKFDYDDSDWGVYYLITVYADGTVIIDNSKSITDKTLELFTICENTYSENEKREEAIKESEKYKEFTRIFKIDMEEHDG